jgi:O-acetyl-ADP-ribose deacetylase (regulator of RNase III)
MGKGIALQFKQAFPDNYAAYPAACKRGNVEPGKMFVFPMNTLHNPRFIINFPTKRHWKGKSRLQDIESGLKALIEVVRQEKIRSIAVPPLGCGNGGLDWDEVRARIERAFAEVPDVASDPAKTASTRGHWVTYQINGTKRYLTLF